MARVAVLNPKDLALQTDCKLVAGEMQKML